MNFDMLKQFCNAGFFVQGDVTITPESFVYSNGDEIRTLGSPYTLRIQKVIVPVGIKDLIDAGLGEYANNETFNLFVRKQLNFPNGSALKNGDRISFDGYNYKIISSLNFKTHGFYKYLITKFNEVTLND